MELFPENMSKIYSELTRNGKMENIHWIKNLPYFIEKDEFILIHG
jgi:hypothetical protein